MSSAVFPVLPGLQYGIIKQPEFNTAIKRSVSLKEYRAAFAQTPLWNFTFNYDVLRDSAALLELQKLIGFFTARQGAFDTFLYSDPSDNSVTAQNFGTGTGSATVFPLIRTYGAGGFTANDTVNNPLVITTITDGGVTIPQGSGAGKYTVDSLGNITFGTAPANGHALTWTGTFYYRCRFLKDTLDFKNFMSGYWDLSDLSFVGSPQNKVGT